MMSVCVFVGLYCGHLYRSMWQLSNQHLLKHPGNTWHTHCGTWMIQNKLYVVSCYHHTHLAAFLHIQINNTFSFHKTLRGHDMCFGAWRSSLQCCCVVQKYTHVRQSQRGTRPYYTSRLWWCGILLMGLGELGNFAAYGFAPASLIAPLGCVSVIGKPFSNFTRILNTSSIFDTSNEDMCFSSSECCHFCGVSQGNVTCFRYSRWDLVSYSQFFCWVSSIGY